MSEQSLREALEKRLGTLPVMAYSNGYMVEALPKAELLSLLAAHPAEPAPDLVITEEEAAGYREQLDDTSWPSALSAYERGENPAPIVTDDAVMAAARVLGGEDPPVMQMDAARIALEAAVPLLCRPSVGNEP